MVLFDRSFRVRKFEWYHYSTGRKFNILARGVGDAKEKHKKRQDFRSMSGSV
jgi:hypothetical protein